MTAYAVQTWADGSGGGTPITAATLSHIESGISVSDANATTALGQLGKPLALTGAVAATRYVGATSSGAPVTGTFAVGDFAVAQNGPFWVCTAAGTPGTWAPAAPINFSIPFHVANSLATGLKAPKWIATQNCTLRLAKAVLDSGSAAKFQIYVNGAAPTGMVDSGTVGTSVITHDFTDVTINAGDMVAVNVTNAGTAAFNLSVTIDAVWR